MRRIVTGAGALLSHARLSGAVLAALLFCGMALVAAGCSGTETPSTPAGPQTTATAVPGGGPSGGPDGESTTTAGPSPETSIVKGDDAAWGETLRCRNTEQGISLNVVVHEPEDVPDSEMGMSDPELNRLVALLVGIENTGERAVGMLPDWFELEGGDGLVYKRARLTDSPVELLEPGNVAAGATLTGYVVFEVPADVAITAGTCDISLGAKPDVRLTWSE